MKNYSDGKKKNRKPLVIEGARQVGKIWLMKEFGQRAYGQTVYISFDSPYHHKIGALLGEKIRPDSTLLIFDEVQEVPKALSSPKYFYENAPEISIRTSMVNYKREDGLGLV